MNEFVTGLALFLRNGRSKVQMLHRGTKEDCERMQDLVPAVAVSLEDQVEEARVFMRPAQQWDEFVTRASESEFDGKA